MAAEHQGHTTSVIVEHFRESGLITVNFAWQDMQLEPGAVTDTYTISVGNYASLEMDKAIPVRPYAMTILEQLVTRRKAARLANLVGQELVEQMLAESSNDLAVGESVLSFENRRAIASLQASDPSTPQHLRQACAAMLDSQLRLDRSAS